MVGRRCVAGSAQCGGGQSQLSRKRAEQIWALRNAIRDMSAQYVCIIVEIRPTLQTLKALRNADLLAPEIASAYDGAKRADDAQVTLNQLTKLGLSRIDVNLLNDPRTLIENGKFPDTHKTSSQAARESIYELRDHSGGACSQRLEFVQLSTRQCDMIADFVS